MTAAPTAAAPTAAGASAGGARTTRARAGAAGAGRAPARSGRGGRVAPGVHGAGRERDRGSVTAELALALPAVVGLLAAVLLLCAAGVSQLRCADAARAGARAAALGEDAGVVTAVARRLAGPGATVQVVESDPWVTVTVRRPLTGGPLTGAGPTAGLAAEGRAVARVEP